MEQSLNRIFGATRNRRIVRRTFLYWSVMTLAPVVLAAMVYTGRQLIAAVEHMAGIAWLLAFVGWLAPIVGGILVLSALYKFLPNADVPFRSALGGAIVAVPLWLIAKGAFGLYVDKCVATGNLYGALGLLPLFLLWLNLSWTIFLFGAQLAHTAVNLTDLEAMERAKRLTLRPTDLLATAVAVAEPHVSGTGPVPRGRIAERLQLPDDCVQRLLDRLMASGLICPVEGDKEEAGDYVLARSANTIPVLEVLEIQAGQLEQDDRHYDEGVQSIVRRVRHEADASLGSLTLADLIPPKSAAS
jgi:membrane protein